MNKLLYYPTISIPDPSWLPKVLLYWDGIATIAPVQYLEDPDRFSPLMRSLLREGLVEIVQSEEYVYSHYGEYNTFLDWALRNADSFAPAPRRLGGGRSTPCSPHDIHTGKFSHRFADELVRAGLSKRIDDECFKWIKIGNGIYDIFGSSDRTGN